MNADRPDIPVLTVSWINNRLKEMASEQSNYDVDGEDYIDRKGQFLSASWSFLRDGILNIYESVLKPGRR
ncbi:hypothetical protein Pla110_30050 [Polystyrenella longa]|uniref:Uncharacterized protein n=1 Tax=Polystyrenella longa TaxID=2528007 RepID=A0A518CPW4_9PLAN|nr:hypothetical protein [Polystyrenella longa]QDU81265.1 hypothetical protein Pla110_30050 [Polystyrenella longa]